jgi:hypothetical protein
MDLEHNDKGEIMDALTDDYANPTTQIGLEVPGAVQNCSQVHVRITAHQEALLAYVRERADLARHIATHEPKVFDMECETCLAGSERMDWAKGTFERTALDLSYTLGESLCVC